MKRVIVSGNTRKPTVAAAWRDLVPWLQERADLVLADDSLDHDLSATAADLVVVLGGDGAILSVARRLGANQVPVVGVNLGKLGFLAELSPASFREHFKAILDGAGGLSRRMMLTCELRRGPETIARYLAVNDAVVSRGALSRLVTIGLLIDGRHTTTYNGDGVIVSTPTGSTAHSLSAGGPVVDPQLEAILVTPICPHTLTNRPVVLPATGEIELRAEATPVVVGLTIDGQVYEELRQGDRVVLRRAPRPFQLVALPSRTFYDTLREKLNWGGSAR
jgi:NAD+ kinase